uniref:Peptidase_M14 domain-containing protein n=1 Tax=Parastrongyloides trichosuri TaxID=131310 RepID=A0A0N4ZG08_PARTI
MKRFSILVILYLSNFIYILDGLVQPFDFSRYHGYTEIRQFIKDVAKNNPTITRLVPIGHSHEGRTLEGLKIGSGIHNTSKPVVWIDGGNHAREWPAAHFTMFFIKELVDGYGKNEEITKYLDDMNIYAFPLLNPDGFVFTKSSKKSTIRQWRKNKAPENCTGWTYFNHKICCDGVDLNRNFDIGFDPLSKSFGNPCSDEYQGPFPFSEPETRAVRDFILSKEIKGKLKGLVSLHTHGQFIVVPYNYKLHEYPPDYDKMMELGEKIRSTIKAFKGTDYMLGTAADLFKMPASGGQIDWVKKNTDIKYVYLFELPPEWKTWFAFQMREWHLIHTAEETWQGVKVLLKRCHQEFVNGMTF